MRRSHSILLYVVLFLTGANFGFHLSVPSSPSSQPEIEVQEHLTPEAKDWLDAEANRLWKEHLEKLADEAIDAHGVWKDIQRGIERD